MGSINYCLGKKDEENQIEKKKGKYPTKIKILKKTKTEIIMNIQKI